MTEPTTRPPVIPNPYAYTPPPDDTSPRIVRNARVGITLLLLFLGARAFRDEFGQVPLISGINVAVHEFGHMLFMPFGIPVLGDTMVILGGSLFQVMLPTIFVGYFLFSKAHRDVHAAMCCLWWTSMNLISVAIYTADARARQLTLINGLTGQEDDSGHDWYNLLSQWGRLNKDTLYASQMRGIALLLFFASIAVGLWYAWKTPPANVARSS